ncbi:glycosyltransferase family 4 protein [Spirosoma utsteinense]|uniref:Glycosyltransferase involved in cell wall biosynthesis n=1 Tax=Spirosoma utsteinense TaxID=2585773 RepID=A0ABR6W5V5_9BACT|nr:glycosyltransferase family 4 protein [Spirosoma utsteinense]MBC3786334.1 glycosyltransferase involved in cell wall biosynthesis [Spirosoma utsteinense]MBC3791960.1 glycosyltransferase involved in cell wall biosynthesis [Spirosoma utsteinense]
MRILIIHNILWAHYKASVFQALQQAVDQHPGITLKVLQIARNERSRAGLETAVADGTAPTYTYNYELLFDRFLEDVSLADRTRALLRAVRAFKPDVINLTGYYDPAQQLLLLWANANGVRVVMQSESTMADQQRGGWKDQLKRWLLSRCDGFFCFGNQSADYLIKLGVPPEKVLMRKNAVDNESLRAVFEKALPTRSSQQQALGLRPNNIVFVGRLIGVKNLPMLVTAFAEARKRSLAAASWGLIMLGDGAEQDRLTAQIQSLGLADAVHILPGRPWFQVPQVLALSNVLALPSRSEPWGLVVNEAMACGLPVIVSNRCGCVPDLVHDRRNGFVFDPDEPNQLVEQLTGFMNGSVDIDRMSRLAEASVISYAPDAVAREMLDGFRRVVLRSSKAAHFSA